MAFYYVGDSGGTATGDVSFGTAKTGTFPTTTEAYADLADWISGASPADGDIVCCRSDYTEAAAGSIQIITPNMSGGEVVIIVSVDPTACDTFQAGAQIANFTSATARYEVNDSHLATIFGCDWASTAVQNVGIAYADRRGRLHLIENNLTNDSDSSAGRTLQVDRDGAYLIAAGCDLDQKQTTNGQGYYAIAERGGLMELLYCTTSGAAGEGPDTLMNLDARNAGSWGRIVGGDYSEIEGKVFDFAENTTIDQIVARCFGAKLGSGLDDPPLNETDTSGTSALRDIAIIASDNSDPARHIHFTGPAMIEELTTPYRTAQTTLEKPAGNVQHTLEVHTKMHCNKARKVVLELPVSFKDFSASANDTITCYFAVSAGDANTNDIALFASYVATGETIAQTVVSSTPGNANPWVDPMDDTTTGHTDTSGSGLWTGTINNEYSMSVTLTGAAASSYLLPRVWVEFYEADKIFYVDPELEYS